MLEETRDLQDPRDKNEGKSETQVRMARGAIDGDDKTKRDRYHGEGRDDTGCGVSPRHHRHLHVLVP